MPTLQAPEWREHHATVDIAASLTNASKREPSRGAFYTVVLADVQATEATPACHRPGPPDSVPI